MLPFFCGVSLHTPAIVSTLDFLDFSNVRPEVKVGQLDKTLEPTRKLNTFIHEIVHVLLDHFNAELKLKDEEKVCEVLGTGLSDLFTHNPKLIKVINDVYNPNKK